MSKKQSANKGTFKKGSKGGPGRKKGVPNKATRDIKLLAQEHGPACIEGLAKLMTSKYPAIKIAAMRELLDRGYGRAPQHIQGEVGLAISIIMPTWVQPLTVAPGDHAKLVNGNGSGGGNGSGHPPSE